MNLRFLRNRVSLFFIRAIGVVMLLYVVIYPGIILSARPISGVDTPIPINPTVSISNAQYIVYLYRVLLGRNPDDGGIRNGLKELDKGQAWDAAFRAAFTSEEFRAKSDKGAFITRAYKELLKRDPDPGGFDYWMSALKDASATDGTDWYLFIKGLWETPGYKNSQCHTGYYSYDRPLNADTPTLADLFAGTARFVSLDESERVYYDWKKSASENADEAILEGSKLPVLYNPDNGKYYGFTRGMWYSGGSNQFNVYMLESTDGANFTNIGRVFDRSFGPIIDPHVAVDYSVCPARYIMSIEVGGAFYSSFSSTPFIRGSWSWPVPVVWPAGENISNLVRSASTPVFLIDGVHKYASWTVLDTIQFEKTADFNTESTYTKGIAVTDFTTLLGNSDIGSVLMPAEKDIHCTNSWDCNNRDKQDWKKEGDYFYLIYNGANYYQCERFSADAHNTNIWGIGIVRSNDALSGYDLAGVGKILTGLRNTCSLGYPVINNIGGELYMYYAYWPRELVDGSYYGRSKLVWVNSTTTPAGNPVDILKNNVSGVNYGDLKYILDHFGQVDTTGDIDKSGRVSLFDYAAVVNAYGSPQ